MLDSFNVIITTIIMSEGEISDSYNPCFTLIIVKEVILAFKNSLSD